MIAIRRRQTAQVSHERWLVSYADFVTLLFAFFVVLYASAQVDRQRALQLSEEIRSGFQELGVFQAQEPESKGLNAVPSDAMTELERKMNDAHFAADKAAELERIRSELERVLAAQIARKEVELHMGPDGLIVTLREVGFFDSGSAAIKPGAEKAFARVAEVLRTHSCTLRIEGHTDRVPIRTAQFASNWELSTARATGLVKSLVDEYGISPALLSAAGYAEFHPASLNDTSKGRALNRRVDLVILNSEPASRLGTPAGKVPGSSYPITQ